MKKIIFLTLVIMLFSISSVRAETKSNKSLKILFIGNSLTFHHNIPDLVGQIAYYKFKKAQIDEYVPGNTNFRAHFESKECLDIIKNNKYDVVVLQSASFEPISGPEGLKKYGIKLQEKIKKSGARTVFFMTWEYHGMADWIKETKDAELIKLAEKEIPTMYSKVRDVYIDLTKETGSEIAPVGMAWNMIMKSMPDLMLYESDNSHPSEKGSFLSAIVLYSVIFEEEPKNIPSSLYPYKREKDQRAKNYIINLNFSEKMKMEQIAAKAIAEAKKMLSK
ncbi:MAG: DUF4886 domain-containing protein [Candidatus Firestonebacteria bacterium]